MMCTCHIICVLLLFTVCCKQILAEVIDVDITLPDSSYTYTADLDSQQLEYRCVNGSAASGQFIWTYNSIGYTNPLNAYDFYGVLRSAGTYTIGCYSGTDRLGDMQLTIKGRNKLCTEIRDRSSVT